MPSSGNWIGDITKTSTSPFSSACLALFLSSGRFQCCRVREAPRDWTPTNLWSLIPAASASSPSGLGTYHMRLCAAKKDALALGGAGRDLLVLRSFVLSGCPDRQKVAARTSPASNHPRFAIVIIADLSSVKRNVVRERLDSRVHIP